MTLIKATQHLWDTANRVVKESNIDYEYMTHAESCNHRIRLLTEAALAYAVAVENDNYNAC